MINHQNGDLVSVSEQIEKVRPMYDPMDLLAELGPTTDLAVLVRRVVQDDRPLVVVSSASVAAWEQRDPASWVSVSKWLAARRVTVIQS